MTEDQDEYYGRPEASNSDLSMLAKYWQPFQISYDIEKAYRFGTLVDCMLTEPHRVDYYRFTCCDWQYTAEEFAQAEEMKKSFLRDELCRILVQQSDLQKVTVRPKFRIVYAGLIFYLPMRMKADFNAKRILKMLADLKTTTAKTTKEFIAMIKAFSYDRQAAVYMDMEDCDQFMLIGISKSPPYQVFKVAIRRGDDLYLSGKAKYEELGFLYYTLFYHLEIKIAA